MQHATATKKRCLFLAAVLLYTAARVAQPSAAAAAPAFRLDGLPADAPFGWSEPIHFAAPAAPSRATGPQPQDAGQNAYLDPKNPNILGETYLGANYTVPAGGNTTYFGSLTVGYNGTATVSHGSGILNLSTVLYLGQNPGASGKYDLSGSGILYAGYEYIGVQGTGTFTQSTGTANTVSSDLALGYNASGNGTYTLAGGRLLVSGNEYIGEYGTGTFTQSNGGTHTISNYLYLGDSQGGNGTYNLNGGTLQVHEVLSGDGTSTFNFNGGTLQPSTNTTTFFRYLTTANVQAGGAIFNTQPLNLKAYNVTVAQDLLTGTASGTADGGLTKLGSGTLTLTGNNTYTGPTNVNAGTLLVNGVHTGKGTVTVAGSGSTLGGTGTLAGPVNVTTGTLAPGANVGKLTVGALTLSSTATSVFDLSSGTSYDQLVANGNVVLGGSTLTLNVPTANQTFTAGQVLDLFHANGGKLTGTFSNFANNGTYTYGGETFQANYTTTDFTLTALTSVPEPATWAGGALLLGATVLTLRRRFAAAPRA